MKNKIIKTCVKCCNAQAKENSNYCVGCEKNKKFKGHILNKFGFTIK